MERVENQGNKRRLVCNVAGVPSLSKGVPIDQDYWLNRYRETRCSYESAKCAEHALVYWRLLKLYRSLALPSATLEDTSLPKVETLNFDLPVRARQLVAASFG